MKRKPIARMTRAVDTVITHDYGESIRATDTADPDWWVEVRKDSRGKLKLNGSNCPIKTVPAKGTYDPDKKVWVTP